MPVVVQSGSRQYIVSRGQTFVVNRLKNCQEGEIIDLPVLYSFGQDKGLQSLQVKVVRHQKGKKIRVVRYRAKSNYHKVKGFRPKETVLQVL